MPSLDQLKQEIKEEASDNPEKFFATDVIREKDFKRGECENCGTVFWSYNEERKVCGEPECGDGYTFINDSPIDDSYGYIESWNKFRDFMADRGYKPIDRYPVIARWRDDVEFVGGSIYNFQPHVVSGEVEPPAEELVVPQPSLRFNDIDNVGVTGIVLDFTGDFLSYTVSWNRQVNVGFFNLTRSKVGNLIGIIHFGLSHVGFYVIFSVINFQFECAVFLIVGCPE